MPYEVVARTFEHEVHFICPDEAVADALAPLSTHPKMPSTHVDGIQLQIVSVGTGYYDFDGDLEGSPGTTAHIFARAHMYINKLLLSEAGLNPLLVAGSMVLADRRFVILADDDLDRLVFMMNCLSMGAKVEVDRFVCVRDETVMPFPKRLHVASGAAHLFPPIMGQVLASPYFVDWHGRVIHAVDPGAVIGSWEICQGPADVIVFLEPNYGGNTSAGRLLPDEMLDRLIKSANRVKALNGFSFAKLHNLTRLAACWKLRLGTFHRSLWHLERLAELAGV